MSDLVELDEFFAPAASDVVDGLIGQYSAAKSAIVSLAEAVGSGLHAEALRYFIESNTPEQRYATPRTVETLFAVEPAIAQLDADFWHRAMLMTDVLDAMPQKRRYEWLEQIKHPAGVKDHTGKYTVQPLPAFEEDTVRATLHGLLNSRAQFFAERVDGIFRALSRSHVTNKPEGFSKRMIIPGVVDAYGTAHTGHINNLRCVIAKFMGRDEPGHDATRPVVYNARSRSG
jgi:hypothetical protein